MASDAIVSAKDVLGAISELKRLGSQRVLQDLERREPELAEHLLEELTAIYHRLMDLGLSGKALRRVSRRVEALALVMVVSLQLAHRRLWEQQCSVEPRLAQLLPDPTAATPGTPQSTISPAPQEQEPTGET